MDVQLQPLDLSKKSTEKDHSSIGFAINSHLLKLYERSINPSADPVYPYYHKEAGFMATRPISLKNVLPCQICLKTFDRPSLLKRHMRTHTGEKPHVCSVCKKGFSTSSSLNTHRRIHTGEKPHKCLECGKCFTASSNLYYHRMTHTKNKPHKCSLCPRSFPTPGDLRAHRPAHGGAWPHVCPLCARGFAKHTNLKHHLRLHAAAGATPSTGPAAGPSCLLYPYPARGKDISTILGTLHLMKPTTAIDFYSPHLPPQSPPPPQRPDNHLRLL